ncbi:MAG: aspartate kinase [Actinomycetes bacterium]|jgi:aspartate kinase
MGLVVQKYGGSSVADADSVRRVASRIVDTVKNGDDCVVVVSAMGDTTDELLDLAEQVSPEPPARELDMLLTAGERIAMAVLAMAIADLGYQARSYTGSQAGLITTASHGSAKIIDVTPGRISEAISQGAIPIVAGFQGVSQDTKDVTTLGRGGSDTTAVALAAALNADKCEIYTDVDGIFSADPRIAPKARQIPVTTYEEMLELTANGAKVLHLRCVEYARRSEMPLWVRSSFSDAPGSLVTTAEYMKGENVEHAIISGVTHDLSEAKITVAGIADQPGRAAAVFELLADAEVNLDMIVQNVSAAGQTDITFTIAMADGERTKIMLLEYQAELGFSDLIYDEKVAKISLVGAAMRSHPGVSATTFRALADAGINVEMISTSEIRISVVTRVEEAARAVQAIHSAFGLDTDGEAVVYAGTGR